MPNRFKQPCIFPDLTAAPVPCVPKFSVSHCCGCDERCDGICADLNWQHKFFGEDLCQPCQGAKIETKWGIPPASLTSLLLPPGPGDPGETLWYEVWRTRLLTGNEPGLDQACNTDCPSNPSGFSSHPALLEECTPVLKFYDAVAAETLFASDLIEGDPRLAGAQLFRYQYQPDPDTCEGIMPNFVLIARAHAGVGIGTRELARCFLCPRTPTITDAWRKPKICNGGPCCPDPESLPSPVLVTIDGAEYSVPLLVEAGFYQYNGLVIFPDGADSGQINISCSVVGADVVWTLTVYKIIDDEQICGSGWTHGGLTGIYTFGGGDCGWDDTSVASVA